MTIFGIGIDVVEVERITSSMAEFGERFTDKIFTQNEQDYCNSQKYSAIHYAARFAAKEAVAKAFGTGIGKSIGWLDMEISRRESGEPEVLLLGNARKFADDHHFTQIKISLTHTKQYAAANTVILASK